MWSFFSYCVFFSFLTAYFKSAMQKCHDMGGRLTNDRIYISLGLVTPSFMACFKILRNQHRLMLRFCCYSTAVYVVWWKYKSFIELGFKYFNYIRDGWRCVCVFFFINGNFTHPLPKFHETKHYLESTNDQEL